MFIFTSSNMAPSNGSQNIDHTICKLETQFAISGVKDDKHKIMQTLALGDAAFFVEMQYYAKTPIAWEEFKIK